MSDVREFKIEVPDADLDYLRRRLEGARFPDAETPDDWSQGVPLAYAHELVDYWLNEYDWRAREVYFNRHPQFKTEIDTHTHDRIGSQRPVMHMIDGSVCSGCSTRCATCFNDRRTSLLHCRDEVAFVPVHVDETHRIIARD